MDSYEHWPRDVQQGPSVCIFRAVYIVNQLSIGSGSYSIFNCHIEPALGARPGASGAPYIFAATVYTDMGFIY